MTIRRATIERLLAGLALSAGCANSHSGDADAGSGVSPSDGATTADRFAVPDAEACAATTAVADEALAPADIIWVVDSSGSMNDENVAVQNALNDFSAFIAGSGIDYHVILIGDAGSMSVPPPLGGSAEFLHVDMSVSSTNALERIVEAYPMYQGFLRAGAQIHFVAVTDDESNWSRSRFDSELAALSSPSFANGYVFHAICSEEVEVFNLPPIPPIIVPCSGGLGAGGADQPGVTYIEMVAATGGVWKSICSNEWNPIFAAVAAAVSVGVALPCTFDIPAPPLGETLDPDQVNVVFTATGASSTTIPQVQSAAACGAGGGWYYDDLLLPTQIIVCPTTCVEFTNDAEGSVSIEFGCATVVN